MLRLARVERFSQMPTETTPLCTGTALHAGLAVIRTILNIAHDLSWVWAGMFGSAWHKKVLDARFCVTRRPLCAL